MDKFDLEKCKNEVLQTIFPRYDIKKDLNYKSFFFDMEEEKRRKNRIKNMVKKYWCERQLSNSVNSVETTYKSACCKFKDELKTEDSKKNFLENNFFEKCNWYQNGYCLDLGVSYDSEYLSVLYKFEGNCLVYDAVKNKYLAFDNRKIRPVLNKLKYFQSLDDDYNGNMIIQYIIENILVTKSNLLEIPYDLNNKWIQTIKLTLVDYLLIQGDKFRDLSDIRKLNSYRNEFMELIGIKGIIEKSYIFLNKKYFSYEITPYLIKVLFAMTNGDIEKLNMLAKLIAKIFLKRNLCVKLNIDSSRLTVIKTNNIFFVQQFFRALFFKREESTFKMLEWCVSDDCDGTFADFKRISMPGYKTNGNAYTEYTLSELCDSNNIGKFIEDKIVGHSLNVCSDLLNVSKSDTKQFKNILSGRTISGRNRYLGNQSIKLETYNILLVKSISEINKLGLEDYNYDVIEFANEISPEEYIYRGKSFFSLFEQSFLGRVLSMFGLKLLIDDKKERCCDENKEYNSRKFLSLFFKHCCILVKNGNKKKDVTALRTLKVGYNIFLNNLGYPGNHKLDKKMINDYDSAIEILLDKIDKIRERDLSNGYNKDEVLAKGSQANYVLGVVINPKNEIIQVAKSLKKEIHKKSKEVSLEEFIKYCHEEVVEVFSECYNEDSSEYRNKGLIEEKYFNL